MISPITNSWFHFAFAAHEQDRENCDFFQLLEELLLKAVMVQMHSIKLIVSENDLGTLLKSI